MFDSVIRTRRKREREREKRKRKLAREENCEENGLSSYEFLSTMRNLFLSCGEGATGTTPRLSSSTKKIYIVYHGASGEKKIEKPYSPVPSNVFASASLSPFSIRSRKCRSVTIMPNVDFVHPVTASDCFRHVVSRQTRSEIDRVVQQ